MNNSVEKEIFEVYVDDILPNRFQPRLTFDDKALKELSDSIREHGVIQPLVVRKLGDKYEIIAGERRYKASVLAGLNKVPVIVMNIDDNKSAEIAIVENIQRKEMTPLEEAKSYKKLLDRGYLTQDQLATRMGKSQPAIANKLRLLNLSEEVQDALLHEKISERHARSLLSIKNMNEQNEMLNEILSKKLTVKQTDDMVRQKYGTIDTASAENSEEGMSIKNLQTYVPIKQSTPNPFGIYEPNPQIDLINRLNAVNPDIQKEIREEISKNEIDINSQININESPREFTEKQETANQMFDIDINKLKEDAVDINIPSPVANVNELLQPTKEETAAAEQIVDNLPKNKFIFDFAEAKQDIEVLDIVDSNIEEKKEEANPNPNDTKTAVDIIKNNLSELEKKGYRITTEEFDFEKEYQIIIKVGK